MLVFIWVVAVLLMGAWSLCAWMLHALMSVDKGSLDHLGAVLERVPAGTPLDDWMPGWRELLLSSTGFAQAVLGWVGDSAPSLAWVLWGAGTTVLVLLAAFFSQLVVLLRPPAMPRRRPLVFPD